MELPEKYRSIWNKVLAINETEFWYEWMLKKGIGIPQKCHRCKEPIESGQTYLECLDMPTRSLCTMCATLYDLKMVGFRPGIDLRLRKLYQFRVIPNDLIQFTLAYKALTKGNVLEFIHSQKVLGFKWQEDGLNYVATLKMGRLPHRREECYCYGFLFRSLKYNKETGEEAVELPDWLNIKQ